MVYKLKVADDILQVAYQTKLEEYHRVDALLAFLYIIRTGKHVQETQIQNAFSTTIEIVFLDSFTQLETGEQLLLIFLFSLHT